MIRIHSRSALAIFAVAAACRTVEPRAAGAAPVAAASEAQAGGSAKPDAGTASGQAGSDAGAASGQAGHDASGHAGHDAAAAEGPAAAPPPLYADLGDLHHEIRTSVPAAQRYFDQGLRLMFAFNHDEAIKAFQQAAALDPQCAMCLWGSALALGPNINLPTDPDREKQAWDLVARARALRPEGAEKDYIDAVAKRYANPPGADRKALDVAYADAMRSVSRAHPADVDAAVLFAEAMMDLRPWDLWTHDGKPQPGTQEILATLERALAAAPGHPGANHFYIHATEGSPHPEKALAAAARLPGLMPGAGHIVHMPAHTYLRTGRYEDAAEANRRAIEADRKYLSASNAQGIYAMMYVVHNFQFLWAAASFEGRSAEALQAARDVVQHLPEDMVRQMEPQMAGIDFLLTPPLFALARFGRWQEILATKMPPADFQYETAVWHYARGLAFSAIGKRDEALREHAALQAFVKALPADAMIGPLNSAKAIFTVADRLLAGELEARTGDRTRAVGLLRGAVEAEDALGYDEPPPWGQPARLSLGAVLLEAGKARDAEAVFREDLRRTPDNGWALLGLSQALEKQKSKEAAGVRARYERAFSRADVRLTSARY